MNDEQFYGMTNDELFDLKCDILPYTDKEIEYTIEEQEMKGWLSHMGIMNGF